MVKKTVVLCSGGIDSIGLLWNLLNDTDEEILVQHISHKGFLNQWEYEEYGFQKCMRYMIRKCRPFVILPVMEYHSPGSPEYRVRAALSGAISSLLNNADRMVVGTVNFESIPHTEASLRTALAAKKVFKIVVSNDTIIREQPIKYFDKKDWFSQLPKELIEKTVTCRNPSYKHKEWITCKKCHSCIDYEEAKLGHGPINAERWEEVRIKYEYDKRLVELGKKSVVMFVPTLEHSNIQCLLNLLENTHTHIVIQPIEVIMYNMPIEERRRMKNLIKFLEQIKTRNFIVLPTVKFIANIDLSFRMQELIKSFLIGSTAWLYRNQIEEVISAFPLDQLLKDEYNTIFDTVVTGAFTLKEAVCDNPPALPDLLQKLLD